MKLTKRAIEAVVYHGKVGTAHYLWDDQLSGFGVRIYNSGRKSFVVTYRAKGRQRFHTVGRFGELTLHEARSTAMRVLARTRRGEDPSGDRQAYFRSPTIADLADRYLREHALLKKKASSTKDDTRNWRLHVLPRLGKQKVADVTRADLAGLHSELAATPYVANRVLALLSKAFNLAEVWGWRKDGTNPCRHIERFKERRRERFLSPEELSRLAQVLATAENEQTEWPQVVAAFRLLIFTGCRVGEILNLQWEHVDFEARCLRLPDSKTGSKTIYLSNPALKVLADLDPPEGNPFVVWGVKPGRHLRSLTRPWHRIRGRAGLEDVRLHDLRHSYASFGAGAGLSLRMIGQLLGHSQPVTTQRYAHLAADPVRKAAELIAESVEDAMTTQESQEVVCDSVRADCG